MALGTRRNGVAMTRWQVTVPVNLADRVDVLLYDRGKNKPIYGARAQLITDLLYQWVEEKEANLLNQARLTA
jgi:metal-responsive CopG/Arc/MetJ family transcriptional regulator